MKVEDQRYYISNLSEDRIEFIDTREKFQQFSNSISNPALTTVGLDAEFTSSHSDQQINLLQISTHERDFLLDWEVLPSCLQDDDYLMLTTKVFGMERLFPEASRGNPSNV